MKYEGSCHCQKVRFTVEMDITEGLSCNCSICHKRGSILAFTSANNFTLLQGQDDLQDYQFNKNVIHHRFCKHCGILSFADGEHAGHPMKAINLRCLDGFDCDQLPIKKHDGKSA